MNSPRPLKVALVCHSDLLGGAAVVTYRLMQALRNEGVDARMVVYNRMGDDTPDLPVAQIGPRWKRGMKFVGERLPIMLNNGFNRANLFKVSTAATGMPVDRHPWVREADVVNLNWINQGMLSLKGIRRIAAMGKPIVWTMHDMWCLTGICHHAYDCHRYERECGRCPLLNSNTEKDMSRRVWHRKQRLFADVPVHFVAVSSWLKERARQSSMLRDAHIDVIPNAFPIDTFPTRPYENFPSFDPIPNRRRLVMGAARLDDPIKGLDIAVDALNYIFDNRPDVANDTGIILFGELRDRRILDRLRFPYLYMGRITDPKLLRQFYASSEAVISASHFETLPGTLIEGQAAGCLPVTFGQGGQRDIVTHLKDGYIVDERTPEALAEGITWALTQTKDREALHRSVEERFSSAKVASRYIGLYHSLM